MNARQEQARALVVALAGNPNVGKSTLFNRLTGLRQHTGNWPGKTVGSAYGRCEEGGRRFLLADTPGTYSLLARSAEEEAAQEAICFGGADAVIVVCDATCLERSLNLALQVLEMTNRAVICVNLMDEARKRGIKIDLERLEAMLGVPVVGCAARSGAGLSALLARAAQASKGEARPVCVRYAVDIERACAQLAALFPGEQLAVSARFAAMRLLEGDTRLSRRILASMDMREGQMHTLQEARARLDGRRVSDEVVSALFHRAEAIARACVHSRSGALSRQTRLDRLLTGRFTGILTMLALLALVLYLTIAGANRPSAYLASAFSRAEALIAGALRRAGASAALTGALCEGMFRTLGWVVSVMLPPMAIFFPLFTLLEDAGYLPRVAFNLDRHFKRCHACGKQCLTMCMGLGCNAAGVIGCRIIDSPRERLIAILTNSFMPCNGRFPMMLTLIGLFIAPSGALGALCLAGVIVLGVAMTFLASRFLSATALKGQPSAFTLELPPFRRPQIGRVLVRSALDRTLRVLGRAVVVAAPAGLLIWALANVQAGGATLLAHCVRALNPAGRFLGMDGALLLAFVLAFPANELVLPLAMMAYQSTGALSGAHSASSIAGVLLENGWTWLTALNAIVFSLMHWPCSTTVLTVARETRSKKWALVSIALPTACGIAACALISFAARALRLA